jgi:hypothetical protein
MSNAGQAVLTIVGTVVGAAFGNPQLGFMLGSLAGAALFPTKLPGAEGPRLSDLAVQSSAIGIAIPRVYGRMALAGNVIWAPPLREVVTTEEVGGKGGPQQSQTTYSYFGTCAIGLCEGPIAGVVRIWAGAKVLYDKRPRQPSETEADFSTRVRQSAEFEQYLALHLGTESQAPDATMEAVEGIGNVSAYRGLAYAVISNFPLADYGNTLPQFRFEVFTVGVEQCLVVDYDPAGFDGEYLDGIVPRWIVDADDPRNSLNEHKYWVANFFAPPSVTGPWDTLDDALGALATWYGSTLTYMGWSYSGSVVPGADETRPHNRIPGFAPNDAVSRANTLRLHYQASPAGYAPKFPSTTGGSPPAGWPNGVGLAIGDEFWTNNAEYVFHGSVRVLSPTDPAPTGTGWIQRLLDLDGNNITDAVMYSRYDEIIRVRRAFRRCHFVPAQVSVASIVQAECARAGLTSVDVSDLNDDLLDGYAVTRVMTARDAITPLRAFATFDAVESGTVVKFVQRGKAPVATLTVDELGVRPLGGEMAMQYEIERTQDVELPREMRVRYAMPENNFEVGEQKASRLAVRSREIVDLDLPIAMSDSRARQVAEVLLFDAWASRRKTPLALGRARSALEPTDVVLVPISGQLERMRLVEEDRSASGGVIRFQAIYDDDGSFVSYATGAPAQAAPILGYFASTQIVLLDLPALRDADDDAGYYVAARNFGGTQWRGCAIFRSADGGVTYQQLVSIAAPATIGELIATLPAASSDVEDLGSVLRLLPLSGTWSSATTDQLLAGGNAIAVGQPGRWEIVQFRTATKISDAEWRLTGLLRGRRGTEHVVGSSQVGDRVVLLSGAGIARLPLDASAIGATRMHKAVTVGTSVDDATEIAFQPSGAALRPFAPVHLRGSRVANDWLLAWTRRTRLGGTLRGGVDVPLNEQSEAYDVAVMAGAVEKRVIAATNPSATYTAAQQIEDFGAVQSSITVRIYQRSAIVGRGHVLQGTL